MSDVTETRIHTSLLAALEKRCLIWIAKRLPESVNSDHLTGLGAVSMLGAGACYWLGAQYPAALVAAVVCLALNWFGDSLDGTLARVRRRSGRATASTSITSSTSSASCCSSVDWLPAGS